MTPENPFQVLGIDPTTDTQTVRAAYHRGLRAYPAHREPTQFRRLRAAFETLQTPELLAIAYYRWGAAHHETNAASSLDTLLAAELDEARATSDQVSPAQCVRAFVAFASRVPFHAFATPGPSAG